VQCTGQQAITGGGEAIICRAAFLGTPTDAELKRRFLDDLETRFAPVKQALVHCLAALRRRKAASPAGADILRLQQMVDTAMKTDFFGSEDGTEIRTLMTAIKKTLKDSGDAKFRFVDSPGGAVLKGERSFDMVGADFTHEGDTCSLETMTVRLGLKDSVCDRSPRSSTTWI
jgi:hypothetical protein